MAGVCPGNCWCILRFLHIGPCLGASDAFFRHSGMLCIGLNAVFLSVFPPASIPQNSAVAEELKFGEEGTLVYLSFCSSLVAGQDVLVGHRFFVFNSSGAVNVSGAVNHFWLLIIFV